MRLIKFVLAIVFLLVLAIVLMVYLLPEKAHMERSMVINAPSDKVYQEIITFRNFNKWSPWATKDELAEYSYTGPDFGPGAVISWVSENPDVGNGSLQILQAEKNKRVVWEMQFDGYQSRPTASFLLSAVNDHETKVVWTYDEEGISGFSKIFMLGIDGFLGGDYEYGLCRLKSRIDSLPNFQIQIAPEQVPGFYYIGLMDSSLNEPSLINVKMTACFDELEAYAEQHDVTINGARFAFYEQAHSDFSIYFTCGLPVVQIDTVHGDHIGLFYQDSVLSLVGKSSGAYDRLHLAHSELLKFASHYNYDLVGNSWESYLITHDSQPDTFQWKTNIYYPIE